MSGPRAVAGGRFRNSWACSTSRTGRLPETIELDYAKFVAAFEGKASPPAARPAPAPQEPRAAETAPPAKEPEKKQYATDAQVKEFEALVAELGISADVVKQRLAQLGSVEPYGVARADMESILEKLRAAKAQKAGAAAQA